MNSKAVGLERKSCEIQTDIDQWTSGNLSIEDFQRGLDSVKEYKKGNLRAVGIRWQMTRKNVKILLWLAIALTLRHIECVMDVTEYIINFKGTLPGRSLPSPPFQSNSLE